VAPIVNIIVVSGNLQQVKASLQRLSEVIKNREVSGFNMLTHEAEWMFITERDERVCPFCRQLEHTVHRGDYIPQRFPFYSFIDATHIAPEVHLSHPFLKGVCRCVLEAVNIGELCEGQLHQEKLAVL